MEEVLEGLAKAIVRKPKACLNEHLWTSRDGCRNLEAYVLIQLQQY